MCGDAASPRGRREGLSPVLLPSAWDPGVPVSIVREGGLEPPASGFRSRRAGHCATPCLRAEPGSRTRSCCLRGSWLFLMSYFGLAGNRGIEPRPAGFGGPPEPSSSPMRLERWSRTIYMRVMNPPPRPSAFSSGVTNRTRTGTSGFTPRRSALELWPRCEWMESNHLPPAYQTGAPTSAPHSPVVPLPLVARATGRQSRNRVHTQRIERVTFCRKVNSPR